MTSGRRVLGSPSPNPTNQSSQESDTTSVILTPRSSSVFSFSTTGEHEFLQGLGRADHPIPSIENDANSPSPLFLFSPRNTVLTSPTPSISVSTPPPSESLSQPAQNTASPPPRDRDGVSGLAAGLQRMRLPDSATPPSGLDMPELGDALPTISPSVGSPSPSSLRPGSGDATRGEASPTPPTRRRRGSSRPQQRPHDVRDEEPPQDRFHQPAFQQAFSDARGAMGDLSGVLGSSESHFEPDSTIQRLRKQADALANFRCPPTRTVGLVGDSGVGKSSLINSLLDFKGLARTSNGGSACTCVVTEYLFHSTNDFAVDVELFDAEELKEQLAEMIHAYRHNHRHSSEMESNEEREHWEDRANLARDTFHAMFRGRSATGLLQSDESDESVLQTLLHWAQEFGPSNANRHEVRASVEDCSDLLMRLTSETGSAQDPALWPYIKKIKVSLNAHILSKGLILVDLPGLRDLNSARRNITERYLLKCDEILAVCWIGRAVTDAGVAAVFELARQAKLSNVGIVCTKSDDIDPDEARRDWSDARATEVQNRIATLRTAERELAAINESLKEFGGPEEDPLDSEDEAERSDLLRRAERKRLVVDRRELELKHYVITTRNAMVTESLSDLYRGKIPGGNLRVFCASNKMYWEFRLKLPKEEALPSLQLSGIPGIRKHCMAMVSESQLSIAMKYMQDDIPNLLSNIELWVQSGAGTASAEQKQAIQKTLDLLEDRLRKDLCGNNSPVNKLERLLKGVFNEQLYQRTTHRAEWNRGARNAGAIWSTWHHPTYTAFCRNYGDYSTKAARSHNWNEEAMQTMVEDMDESWENSQLILRSHMDEIMRFVSETLDWASDHLDEMLDGYAGSVVPLRQALTSRERLIAGSMDIIFEKFERDLGTLGINALSGLRTSFFGRSMESSYQDANQQYGGGSWARKKAIINGALGRQDLFTGLMRTFRREFEQLAVALQADIQATVNENLDVIRGTLDIIRSDNVALESDMDPAFRARVAEELERADEAMARVQAAAGNGSG